MKSPILIPTYKNRKNNILKSLIQEVHNREIIIVVTQKDWEDNYNSFNLTPNTTLLFSPTNNLIDKTNFAFETLYKKGIKSLYRMDDDLIAAVVRKNNTFEQIDLETAFNRLDAQISPAFFQLGTEPIKTNNNKSSARPICQFYWVNLEKWFRFIKELPKGSYYENNLIFMRATKANLIMKKTDAVHFFYTKIGENGLCGNVDDLRQDTRKIIELEDKDFFVFNERNAIIGLK